MPIREYQCEECETILERIENIDELQEPMTCDKCEIQMERIISKTTFILKGGGWEKDGYQKTTKGKNNVK